MLPRSIARRYRVLNQLGQGSLGQVFLVFDQETRAPVALKLLSPKARGFEERFHTFKTEFDTLRNFRHRNIVQVLDIGQDDSGAPFFTMEHINGPNLIAFGYRSYDELAGLLIQLMRGLGYVHARNYLHRDIKGGNVMVQIGPAGTTGDAGDVVKLLDFGFAVRGATDADVRGTAEYLAPEVLLKGDVDARTDLYAAGCLAYVMLTGHYPGGARHPAPGRDVSRVRQDFERRRAPRSVRAQNADVPTSLEGLVMQLLSYDPAARPASAEEVIERLQGELALSGPAEAPDTAPLPDRYPYVDAEGSLAHVIERFEAPRSGALVVRGHRRYGKSRLLEELRAELATRGAEVIACRFTETGEQSRAPLSRIPRRVLSFHPEQEAELLARFPALYGRGEWLQDADAARTQMEDQLVALLRPEVAARPVVLLIDDLQWADLESLSVLFTAFHRLVPHVAPSSVLLLVATMAADSEMPELPRGLPGAEERALAPLDTAAVRMWLERIGDWGEGLSEVAEFLAAEAGGIPGAMESLWRELCGSGSVANVRGAWRLRGQLERNALDAGHEREWPELARLGAEEREVLAAVAAYDRWVTQTEVEAVCPVRSAPVARHLEILAGAGLLRRSDRHVRIATGSLRTHVEGALPPRARRTLHGRIARSIERHHRESLAEHHEELQRHAEAGGDAEGAERYGVLAAGRLLREHRYSRAIPCLAKALALMAGRADRASGRDRAELCRRIVELELDLARACVLVRRMEDAVAAIGRARSAGRELRDPVLAGLVAAAEADAELSVWRHRELPPPETMEACARSLEDARARLELHAPPPGTAREARAVKADLLFQLAGVRGRQGRHADAVEALQESLGICRVDGGKNAHRTMGLLARHMVLAGRGSEAITVGMDAVAEAERVGDKAGMGVAHAHLAVTFSAHDRVREALQHYRHAEQAFQELRLDTWLSDLRHDHADTLAEIGMAREASRLAHEVLDFHGPSATGSKSARAHLVIGKTLYRLSDYPRARSELEGVLQYAQSVGAADAALRWQSLVYLGRLHLEAGDPAAGRDLLREAAAGAGARGRGQTSLHAFVGDCLLQIAAGAAREALLAKLSGRDLQAHAAEILVALDERRAVLEDEGIAQRHVASALAGLARVYLGEQEAWIESAAAAASARAQEPELCAAEASFAAGIAALSAGEPREASGLLLASLQSLQGLEVVELQVCGHALSVIALAEQGLSAAALEHHRSLLDILKSVCHHFQSREEQERYLSEPLRAALYTAACERVRGRAKVDGGRARG